MTHCKASCDFFPCWQCSNEFPQHCTTLRCFSVSCVISPLILNGSMRSRFLQILLSIFLSLQKTAVQTVSLTLMCWRTENAPHFLTQKLQISVPNGKFHPAFLLFQLQTRYYFMLVNLFWNNEHWLHLL